MKWIKIVWNFLKALFGKIKELFSDEPEVVVVVTSGASGEKPDFAEGEGEEESEGSGEEPREDTEAVEEVAEGGSETQEEGSEDVAGAAEEGAEGEGSSEAGPEADGKYSLTINWLPEGIACDTGKTFEDGYPNSVTIHWIGAYPDQTPEIVRSWWETGGGEGSAHWVIKDNEVLQCWPTCKTAWHCGDSIGNSTSAGIEVIPMDTEGQFSVKSIATLKAVLDDYYPDLPLKRHYDWNGKDCPRYYVDEDRWAQLKALLGRA